jgi:hypothetical protein
MKFLTSLLLTIAASLSQAQPLPLEMQLPDWAVPQWEKLAKDSSLKLSGRINPFLQRGDFNADGRSDLALFVENTKTGKSGIAFIYGGNPSSHVLFAGNPLGNGGDTLDWVDIWNVQDKGSLQYDQSGAQYRLKIDTLLLVKESSSSALLLFDSGHYTWQQQGD